VGAVATEAAAGPVNRPSLVDGAERALRNWLAPGRYRQGDRLPPERELIEIFGISRPSLREALRALSMLGVVKTLHGGGAYVSDLDARTLLAPLDFYLSLTKANFATAGNYTCFCHFERKN